MDLRAATVIAIGGLNKGSGTEGSDLEGDARTFFDYQIHSLRPIFERF